MAANTVLFGIVAFAVVMIAAEMIPPQYLPAKKVTELNLYFPHTEEVMPDTRYYVTILDKNDPRYNTTVVYEFCKEKSPIPFQEGELATSITYKEHGTCKELVHYSLLRQGSNVQKEAFE